MKILYALLIILLWGLWPIYFKLGKKDLATINALFITYLVYTIISIVVIVYLFPKTTTVMNLKSIKYIVVGALVGSLGTIIWYIAVEKYEASIIVPLTALYPLVTVIFGYFVLHEKLKFENYVGIILALIASILLIL